MTTASAPVPYGAWSSPITTELLVAGAVGISEVVPGVDDCWWAESRPTEGGRTAIMRWTSSTGAVEVTPPGANVRTRVHEYGGGAWWAERNMLYYVDDSDQRLRSIDCRGAQAGDVQMLSAEPVVSRGSRFADIRVTADDRWLVAVGELHGEPGSEPVNNIVAVATDGSTQSSILVDGADFFGSPRLSPDGTQLAWVSWNHPNMPWDDTELWRAEVRVESTSDGERLSLGPATLVAGGVGESIVQPEWSPDGRLHFLSDRTDLWHLFVEGTANPVLTVEGDIGYPPWVFGMSRYCFDQEGAVHAARFSDGVEFFDECPDATAFNTIRSMGGPLAYTASSWSQEASVRFGGQVVRAPRDLGLDPAFLAPPEVIGFPTDDDETAYALYFAPANAEAVGPPDERPPLIVLAHGGPTSAARSQLNLSRRFWTSRGFAVVDVNYRGSSGFGRSYRKKLEGQWGIADVADCVNAAKFLVERGDVDPKRLIIRGGSAGGFTVLSALAFHDTFTAGASMYGVADLSALAEDTHKFESRYLDNLVGQWPADEAIYRARSPIHHLDGFSAPMIVLQGDEDEIVPPNQSRMIVDALERRGIAVAYLEFAGEQHGFRKAETIQAALLAELAFYGRIFGFVPAGGASDLEIKNLP